MKLSQTFLVCPKATVPCYSMILGTFPTLLLSQAFENHKYRENMEILDVHEYIAVILLHINIFIEVLTVFALRYCQHCQGLHIITDVWF